MIKIPNKDKKKIKIPLKMLIIEQYYLRLPNLF